jgi:O-antigen/teichoic acid export membrane protein
MVVFGLVILFTAFEVFFFGATVIAASWVLDELSGWAIFVGNVVAAVAMLGFFFHRHRDLASRLNETWLEED